MLTEIGYFRHILTYVFLAVLTEQKKSASTKIFVIAATRNAQHIRINSQHKICVGKQIYSLCKISAIVSVTVQTQSLLCTIMSCFINMYK